MTAHWGLPDPAVEGDDAAKAKAKAFMSNAATRKRRIDAMLSLPMKRLGATAIERESTDIGKA